ncbi:MAG TPA: hypothetical protein PKO09_06870 [Anaerolineae bacterium]|nr:hypothetical protein [Anaerolineae bacterium]
MQVFADLFGFLTGTPAMVGLLLTAWVIFVAADWRVALSALLVQYILVGLALVGTVQVELVVVRILTGVLATAILYLSARHVPAGGDEADEEGRPHILGLQVRWLAGPLGFPLRLLASLLVVLMVVLVFQNYKLETVPMGLALMAFWMAGMGILGLVLSGHPLRAALAGMTFLAGFDLVFAALESSLALVGFLSAFYLLAALGFSYLVAAHYLVGSGSPGGRAQG